MNFVFILKQVQVTPIYHVHLLFSPILINKKSLVTLPARRAVLKTLSECSVRWSVRQNLEILGPRNFWVSSKPPITKVETEATS